MCGIIGGFNKNFEIRELESALLKLSHRGPDSSNYILKEDFFLGHTRLAIVDLTGGEQPLVNEDQTIFSIVNGEFYDYESIRISLLKKGHTFKTESDSEILIHLYEEYGVECLKFLHGEFAFVLYDKNKKRWFCARDRMGVRPLQFFFDKESFIVGSEAKAIFEFKKVKPELDRESFWFSQHLQYLPLDKTLFKNVEMIKPGYFLLLNEGENPKQVKYWDIQEVKEKKISFDEAKEESKRLIQKAVEKRIPKEVKWATHLSGGIDSSIVTACSNKFKDKELTSFTVKFTDDVFYDESKFAQETADFLGSKLIQIPVSFSDIIRNIPAAVYHGEGLSINGHLGAKFILNKIIKENGFKVALSGEGSDEIFMGYSHLKQDFLSSKKLKDMEKQYLTGFQLPDENTLDLSAIEKQFGFVPTWIAAKSSMAFKFKNLWDNDFKYETNPYSEIISELSGYQTNLKMASASWMKYCLNGYILKVLDDGQSMAHGIEGRLPFLDTELVEFMYSVPDDIYFHNDVEKGLLREGFKNDLPSSIINKTKQSFMSPPINRFINNKEFKSLVEKYILENNKFKDLNVFDVEKIKRLLCSDSNEKNSALEPIIMTVLSLGVISGEFL